tara:strand:+ start:4569 stop:5651 length:1083 start_codon:yes stop_codon:yes gene_type:complete
VSQINLKILDLAHNIAKKKFGQTFPNPTVGCIIAKNKKIISKAVTSQSGRPHAEEIALEKAGAKSKGATMYVTLEPCFHSSKHGSCADQILRSGIKEIFISSPDPDIRTYKKSINKLKKNNVIVKVGIGEKETYNLNKFFFKSLIKKQPFTKVKLAISQDEKIAWHNYKSKWISNEISREFGHKLRSISQAILTTSKTIIKDNPKLTVRLKKNIEMHIPIIVIDKNLKIPINSKILKDISKKRIIIFTSVKNKKSRNLTKLGCEVIYSKLNQKNELNLKSVFKKIYSLKISDILVEAGGILFTNLLKNKLVDEIHIFQSKIIIGHNGKPAILGKKINDLKISLQESKKFRTDIYHNYKVG